MHESNLLGAFVYAWGYRDGQSKRPSASLLLTPQSFLDHLVGDLVGSSPEGRWFIVEFKRERVGIKQEITRKTARKNLMGMLWNDPKAAQLSAYGHFACWLDEELALEQYVVAADDERFRRVDIKNFCFMGTTISFDRFYGLLTESDTTPFYERPDDLFSEGSGLTGRGMARYLQAVVGAHPASVNGTREVQVLLGRIPSNGGKTSLIPTSFGGLLDAFSRMRALVKPPVAPRVPARRK